MTAPIATLDLFSGIGGFTLGLQSTGGFRTAAFVEINPFCRRLLAQRFPGVPVYADIRQLTGERLAADGIVPACIVGGFPCQDISVAGQGRGLAGERSGLWWEFARLIEECGPRWVVIENVSALRSRGLDVVLGSLAALGYDAEWNCIPAAAAGAPHQRDRVWVVAHAASRRARCDGQRSDEVAARLAANMADTHADGARLPQRQPQVPGRPRPVCGPGIVRSGWWAVEPDVGRVADDVPDRVDRLVALGNAVVPGIPALIGGWILAAEATASASGAEAAA